METPESESSRKYPRRKREKSKQYTDFEMSMEKIKVKREIKTEVASEEEKENANDSQNEMTTPKTRKYPKRKRAPVKYFDDFDLSQDEESKIKVEPNYSEESTVETDQEDAEDLTNIDTPEISEYEKLRLKNMEENRRMMIQLGLIDPTKEKKLKLEAKPKPRIKKKHEEIKPRPRSLRLLGKTPEGSPLDIFKDSPKASPGVSPQQTRKTEDVLPMGEEGETVDFLDSLKSSLSQDSGTSSLASTDNLINDLRNMKLVDMKKVTSSRVQSLCVHPTEKKLLTLVGSIHGELGLWDVNGMEVAQFEPHCRPINCITVCEYDQSKVITTSHDGTVRRADLNKSVFDLIYQTGEDQDMCHLTWHSQLDDNTLMVAHGTGDVGFVDVRTKRPERWYQCHRRSVRTIHIHPTQPHYFLTASGIGECKIWDMRGMKKYCDTEAVSDLSTLDTGKGLTSGFFSPDGNRVVTTSNDDRLRVFDTTDLSKPTVLRKILHDNHTGQWLSVFKAEFHPLCSDLILVGSMMQPRRIQMYNSAGVLLHELKDDAMTTVTPVISVHPSLPVVLAGNSSGKAHLFTTQEVCDLQNLQLDDK